MKMWEHWLNIQDTRLRGTMPREASGLHNLSFYRAMETNMTSRLYECMGLQKIQELPYQNQAKKMWLKKSGIHIIDLVSENYCIWYGGLDLRYKIP